MMFHSLRSLSLHSGFPSICTKTTVGEADIIVDEDSESQRLQLTQVGSSDT